MASEVLRKMYGNDRKEETDRKLNTPALYVGEPRFKSRPGDFYPD
jgi:hypothetical protein